MENADAGPAGLMQRVVGGVAEERFEWPWGLSNKIPRNPQFTTGSVHGVPMMGKKSPPIRVKGRTRGGWAGEGSVRGGWGRDYGSPVFYPLTAMYDLGAYQHKYSLWLFPTTRH
jgi:hypothetical protein